MVKRKIKFIIVPHHPGEKTRAFRFPVLVFLLLVLGIVIAASIFLKNLSYYVDVTTIPEMEEDNRLLKEKLLVFKSRVDSLNNELESLKKKQKGILKKYKFSVPEKIEAGTEHMDVDSLLVEAGMTEQILKKALEIVREKGKNIPSIIPVGGIIVKKFGKSWDLYTERWKKCNGIGISAPEGTEVVATANGIVSKTGKDLYLGNFVEITHNKKYKTIYGHLKSIDVKGGQRVVRGEKIGEVGRTGRTPFPMLYYEVDVDGVPENPENFIQGRTE